MRTLAEIKADIATAIADYEASRLTLPLPQLEAKAQAVRLLREELSAAISEGADPCGGCDQVPIGIEHPTPRGGFEYEVGCPWCPPVVHDEGTPTETLRERRVRIGGLPATAVAAWNEGPDRWLVKNDA